MVSYYSRLRSFGRTSASVEVPLTAEDAPPTRLKVSCGRGHCQLTVLVRWALALDSERQLTVPSAVTHQLELRRRQFTAPVRSEPASGAASSLLLSSALCVSSRPRGSKRAHRSPDYSAQSVSMKSGQTVKLTVPTRARFSTSQLTALVRLRVSSCPSGCPRAHRTSDSSALSVSSEQTGKATVPLCSGVRFTTSQFTELIMLVRTVRQLMLQLASSPNSCPAQSALRVSWVLGWQLTMSSTLRVSCPTLSSQLARPGPYAQLPV